MPGTECGHRVLSEAQAANAHGGRQASLGELRSSPVPGEAELGVPESEVAAAGDGQQAHEHTISQRTRMAPTSVDALFYMASSLIHTQFAYATVNHDKKPCSNHEQPNSQRKSSSGFTRDLRVKVTPCVQTRLLSWMA